MLTVRRARGGSAAGSGGLGARRGRSAAAGAGAGAAPPEPPKPLRGRGGRSPLPEHLPRETRVVPVPEAERTCPQCGADKKCIGHRTSEVLEFVPAQFKILEEQREKLACPRCPEQGVTTAASEKVMDRGRPGPGLLASILVEKFQDAMPLYRQSQQYARFGVSLSPSTLGDWSAVRARRARARGGEDRGAGARLVLPARRRHGDAACWIAITPAGVKRGHIWAFVGRGSRGVPATRRTGRRSIQPPCCRASPASCRAMATRATARCSATTTDELIVPRAASARLRDAHPRQVREGGQGAAMPERPWRSPYFKAIYRVEASRARRSRLSPAGAQGAARRAVAPPRRRAVRVDPRDAPSARAQIRRCTSPRQYALNQEAGLAALLHRRPLRDR